MHLVEGPLLLGDVEQRLAVDASDLLHQFLDASLPLSAPKSTSLRASSTSRFWSSAVSDLRATFSVARIGQVGDLLADLVERPLGLGLDVLAGGGDEFLALRLALIGGLGLRGVTCALGAGDDVVGLLTGFLQTLPVLGEQLVGFLALRARTPRCSWRPSRPAPRARREIFGNANFLRTSIVIPNASSVQIISPSPGWTRKLPPPSSSVAARTRPAIVSLKGSTAA